MIKHDIIWFVVFKIWKIAVIFGRQWPYCRKYNNCQTLINMIRDVFVSCSCGLLEQGILWERNEIKVSLRQQQKPQAVSIYQYWPLLCHYEQWAVSSYICGCGCWYHQRHHTSHLCIWSGDCIIIVIVGVFGLALTRFMFLCKSSTTPPTYITYNYLMYLETGD